MTTTFVWADSGPGVGLGHLVRCCALAREIQTRGREVTVLTPDERGAVYARTQGLAAATADEGFGGMLGALGDRGRAAGVLDSYRLSRQHYVSARRATTLLVVFSDDPVEVPSCDVVINGVPGADTLGYEPEGDTVYLLGAAYFPLRHEFRDAPPKMIGEKVGRLLVTTGGEDVHGLLGQLTSIARSVYPDAEVVAVTGSAGHAADARSHSEVRTAPADYPVLVRDADVMVCGAGQALIEAAAVGTPSAAMLLGHDQRHQHLAVLGAGACLDGGAWTLSIDQREAVLRDALERLRDQALRAEISGRGRGLIDGCGVERIADVLEERAGREMR